MFSVFIFAPLASEHSGGKKYHSILVYAQPAGMLLIVLRSMHYRLIGL